MTRTLAEKLDLIAGSGKLEEREWRIRSRLNWHTKARSAVRHLLHGERKPSLDEAKQIEAAHLKWCAEQVRINRESTAKLFDAMRQAIDAMETADADFYGPCIEEVREMLLRSGALHRAYRSED